MWNLEKNVQMFLFAQQKQRQRNREQMYDDQETKKKSGMNWRLEVTYMNIVTMYKIDNYWELTLQLRELCLVFFGDLNVKEIQN